MENLADNREIDGKQDLSKSMNFSGLLGMGIGCIFGSSWLVMAGTWLDISGGPINAIIAFVLCLVVELPLALSYLEAVPMIPLAGGEMIYSYLAFGGFAGMIAGWFGAVVNIILCAWESIAITKMVGYLFPSVKTVGTLYMISGFNVTILLIILGLAVIWGIAFIQYKGVKISTKFQTGTTITVISLVIVSTIVGLTRFNSVNLQPLTIKPMSKGTLSLLVMLPFSVAGWETISKGAEEANLSISRKKVGAAVVISLIFSISMYIITLIVPAGVVPWRDLLKSDVPFATAMRSAGAPIFGILLILAACVGVIGVYNSVFYGATRLLYSMGEVGLIPKKFAYVHPKYKTPTFTIIFVSVIASIAPFIGSAALIPLIDVASFAYIVLWGSTLASVLRLRKTQPDLDRPAKMPGGKLVGYVGLIIALILLLIILIPTSPGSLAWPSEYLLLIGLIALGTILYIFRDKSVSKDEKYKMILGDISKQIIIRDEKS